MDTVSGTASASNTSLLENRDYTVILARSATDYPTPPPGGSQRWENAQESITHLVRQCETLDPDGVTLYVSCRGEGDDCQFRKYDHVTSESLAEVVEANYPPNEINLAKVLPEALQDFLTRRAARQTKPNGEIILVILDGEPKGRVEIAQAIVRASHQLERDEELGIGFVQIGQDPIATGFFQTLDDNLHGAGAKFDIVNTRFLESISPDSLVDFLLDVLAD